jgi:hypothetical protein
MIMINRAEREPRSLSSYSFPARFSGDSRARGGQFKGKVEFSRVDIRYFSRSKPPRCAEKSWAEPASGGCDSEKQTAAVRRAWGLDPERVPRGEAGKVKMADNSGGAVAGEVSDAAGKGPWGGWSPYWRWELPGARRGAERADSVSGIAAAREAAVAQETTR